MHVPTLPGDIKHLHGVRSFGLAENPASPSEYFPSRKRRPFGRTSAAVSFWPVNTYKFESKGAGKEAILGNRSFAVLIKKPVI